MKLNIKKKIRESYVFIIFVAAGISITVLAQRKDGYESLRQDYRQKQFGTTPGITVVPSRAPQSETELFEVAAKVEDSCSKELRVNRYAGRAEVAADAEWSQYKERLSILILDPKLVLAAEALREKKGTAMIRLSAVKLFQVDASSPEECITRYATRAEMLDHRQNVIKDLGLFPGALTTVEDQNMIIKNLIVSMSLQS